MKKCFNVVRIVAFILLVAVLLGYWNEVFKFKDQNGMVGMDIYYRQPENSVDMLIVGSSHAFVDINTGTLWDEYGIASYLLGANIQPLANSYHYIKEALKTQRPEVIMLEGFLLTDNTDYMVPEFIINNTYGLEFGEDSMDTMNDTIPPNADLLEYGLYYGRYHTRYDDLSFDDFYYGTSEEDYYSCFKGFHNLVGVTKGSRPHFNPRRDLTTPLSLRIEYYYRKICQLCKDEGINLVVVVSPYDYYSNLDREKYNEARQIAAEYGFPLIDYNEYYDQMELDFDTDFYDGGHLNVLGTRKYTSFLGQYIENNYNLPDRRLDETGKFDTWEMNAKYLELDYYDYTFRREWGAVEYYKALRELPEEYVIILNITNPRNLGVETKKFLGYYNIPCIRYDDSHIWVIEDRIPACLSQDSNGIYFEEIYNNHHIVADMDGIYIDSRLVNHQSSGLEITVINTVYGSVVDGVTYDGDLLWRS